ncbi:MAG: MATE family efflux transporter [Oscillospiraceae bacterium]|nr:MATE family efflux transporter [Oscillospiraceae bacterium]
MIREKMKKQTDTYFYKSYFTLFGVVAAQSLIVFSVNLADSIMLGRYSETAMSGVSLANQIQFLLQCFINGAGNGLVALGSQYWGKKDTESVKKVFSASFVLSIFMSLVMAAAVAASPSGVLGLLSDKEDIVAEGAKYIAIMAHSYIIFAVSNIIIALLRAVETVRIGFYTSVMTLVINVFLNYALIFGNFGFPELGVKGAAFATLISRIAELIAVVFYLFFADKKLRFMLREVFSVDKRYLRDYLRTGLPLVGSGGSWGIAMFLQTSIIGRLGAAAIGANAVSAPVFQVVGVLYQSASSASGVLTAKTVGEGDIPKVKRYVKKMQIIFLITGVVSTASLLLCKNSIVAFYDISDETRALSFTFINILAVTVLGSAYEAPCLVGIVSGGGDTKFVFKNDIIFMWCIVLPLSALSAFVFKWPVPVTFFILKMDQILKCAVAVIKVNRFKWIRDLTKLSAAEN